MDVTGEICQWGGGASDAPPASTMEVGQDTSHPHPHIEPKYIEPKLKHLQITASLGENSFEFLMQCVLLKMKCNKAYIHIRANLLLPLPSPSTIRRLLSSSECRFGFNELALEHIALALKDLPLKLRLCCLMWDEIQITKDLRFDTRTLKWKGIIDYAGQTTIMVPNGLADSLVCSRFRSQTPPWRWIQPFVWFGTKGAAPGLILVELLAKAMSVLYSKGSVVASCVSDGCTNKSVLKQFGITWRAGVKTSISHPMDPTRNIYFFNDVPHLMKCTRNHMYTHKIVQVSRSIILPKSQ